jgi:UPF0176 protein
VPRVGKSVMPSLPATDADALVHSAFYRFTPLPQPEAVAASLRALLAEPAAGRLTGSILLAREGINGMVAGTAAAVARLEQALQQSPAFDGAFTGMAFARSACTTPPFGRMKVHVKQEIVQLGIAGVDARRTGINVAPTQWRDLIREPDVVLLDNRTDFEYRLGHFDGAIDPQVTNFRDFPRYVQAHASEWKAEGKRVAMYCTGGIRCEKTSAWMQDLGIPTYQLEGGILRYFAQVEDAERDFHGECFVFDNRVALDTRLRETCTTIEDVYGTGPEASWRLERARRLAHAAAA